MVGQLNRTVSVALLSAVVSAVAAAQPSKLPDNPVPTKRFERSFFGLHVLRPFQNRLWRGSGHGTVRLHDLNVSWRDLEPQQGQWQWGRLDDAVKVVSETQADVVLPLQTSPRWASAAPNLQGAYGDGASAPPANFDDWDRYVSTVVQRYRGRIAFYELWNEPNLKKFFSGSPGELAELTARASRIIRSVDPSAKLVCAGITGSYGLDWLDKYLAAGAAQSCDVIGYHLYTSHKKPEVLVELVGKIREVQVRRGVGAKPLWNTESGWLIDYGVPVEAKTAGFGDDARAIRAEQAFAFVLRSHLIARWLGVERFYWYAWDHSEMGLTLGRGVSETPVSRAYTTMIDNLVGGTLERCERNAAAWVCTVKRSDIVDRYYWTDSDNTDAPAAQSGVLFNFDAAGALTRVRSVAASQRLQLTGQPVLVRSAARLR